MEGAKKRKKRDSNSHKKKREAYASASLSLELGEGEERERGGSIQAPLLFRVYNPLLLISASTSALVTVIPAFFALRVRRVR